MFIEAKILENSAAFTLARTKFGNRRQADLGKVETDSDKKMLRLTKELVDSPEYKDICSLQKKVGTWISDRSVPSFFKKGIYLFNLSMVEDVETYLKRNIEKQSALVEKFIEVYPARKEDARSKLNGQFNEKDYPDVSALKTMFTITWNWIQFGIPENLPDEIFKAEKEKAEKMWAEATDAITMCLRESFQKLVSHAADKLAVSPGEKPKIFRNSLIENIKEFISTFNSRNLTDDAELASLVEKTREILTGNDSPEILRDNAALRNNIAAKFEGIKNTLDTMITELPSRKFAFDE